MKNLKILFLPRWYPNRFDPMPGLFIQRQAEALSGLCEVAVLSVHPVAEAENPYEIDVAWENGIFNVRVYYGIRRSDSRITSGIKFLRANFRGLRLLRTFKPDLVHVQVLTRQGLIAWINMLRKRVPYVISEHWSRYYPENNTYNGFLRKLITRMVVGKAKCVITVSETLENAMLSNGLKNDRYFVVPNIVDETQFLPSSNPALQQTRRIIHVSCFEDKSKNITGFLNSVKKVLEERSDFICHMVGDGPDLDLCKHHAAALGLKDSVVFTGMKKDDDLVAEMNTADFLVLSSRYETFGTVVVESLTCGVPVVSTSVGIAPEVINNSNGILVPPGDEAKMTGAILYMLKNCRQYDREKIRSEIKGKFSSDSVGKQLADIYNQVLA